MIRRKYRLLSVFLMLSSLTGCWDYRDIEDRNIVTTVGVDYKNEQVSFHIRSADFRRQKSGGEESTGSVNTVLFTSYGKNFDETRTDLENSAPFPIFLGATQVLVLGRGIAEKSIEPYMHRVSRIHDYRKTVLVVLSREPVEEIIKMQPKNDRSFGFMVNDIIQQRTNEGNALYVTAGDIISRIAFRASGYVIPYIGKEHDSVTYLGFAAMDENSKLIGYLEKDEARGVIYILSQHPKITQVVPHPGDSKNLLSFETVVNKRNISTDHKEGKVVINIDISLNASLTYTYYIEPINEGTKKVFEDLISRKIKKDILSSIRKSQELFGSDIYEFAKYFRADYPEIFKRIDWKDSYRNAEVNIEIKTNILRYGLFDYNAKKAK